MTHINSLAQSLQRWPAAPDAARGGSVGIKLEMRQGIHGVVYGMSSIVLPGVRRFHADSRLSAGSVGGVVRWSFFTDRKATWGQGLCPVQSAFREALTHLDTPMFRMLAFPGK